MLRPFAPVLLACVAATPLAAQMSFTSGAEVRPILSMTQANWVALREFDGQDLLYFTHLAAYRCGLVAVRFALDGEAEEEFPLEPCYRDTPQPNAIRGESWVARPLGAIGKVAVTVVYDDGATDRIEVTRQMILMP